MSKFRKKPTPDLFAPPHILGDPDFEWGDQDRERSDYVLEVMERTEQSKPRLLGLQAWDSTSSASSIGGWMQRDTPSAAVPIVSMKRPLRTLLLVSPR